MMERRVLNTQNSEGFRVDNTTVTLQELQLNDVGNQLPRYLNPPLPQKIPAVRTVAMAVCESILGKNYF